MKLDNYWWVYTMECVPSGRIYVGLTGKPNPAWRWSDHFVQLRNGTSPSPGLQKEWNKYPDLSHWRFGTVGRVEGKVAGNDLEAKTILSIPEDLRLSEKQKTAISQERRAECQKMLSQGHKYKDIAKVMRVSLGWISRVKNYQ